MDNSNPHFQEILHIALQKGASDVHLSAGMPPCLRVDGDLQTLSSGALRLTSEDVLTILQEISNKEQFYKYQSMRELDFSFEIKGMARFRVNAYTQAQGAALAIRIVPEAIKSMEDLQLPAIFYRLMGLSSGLIILTGATGSGKSTTLAALIEHLNKERSYHIVSIEDPIEFVYKSKKSLINQRELHRDTFSLSAALRSAMREDPDVILIGELRDLESIRLAMTLAETGHLVLTTLHSSSCPGAVHRLVDAFPEEEKNLIRSMLAESLQAIVMQKLVKKRDKGRTAAFEIMLASPAIKHLIREGKTAQMYSVIQTSEAKGMQTLERHLQLLVQEGLINRETAISEGLGLG